MNYKIFDPDGKYLVMNEEQYQELKEVMEKIEETSEPCNVAEVHFHMESKITKCKEEFILEEGNPN